LQSHIWLTASSYIRKPFLIYDFATDSIWISLYMRKISFSLLSVHVHYSKKDIGKNVNEIQFYLWMTQGLFFIPERRRPQYVVVISSFNQWKNLRNKMLGIVTLK
jgi:hypothetical protein